MSYSRLSKDEGMMLVVTTSVKPDAKPRSMLLLVVMAIALEL